MSPPDVRDHRAAQPDARDRRAPRAEAHGPATGQDDAHGDALCSDRPATRADAASGSSPRPGSEPWLGIIGIGEDGVEGLGSIARAWLEKSELVFGGRRQLALAAPLIRGEARPWPSPFDRTLRAVLAERGRSVTVLASGDPFHFGVGSLLAERVPAAERCVVPAPSAFSLAAARLGWPVQTTRLLSAHGRALDAVIDALAPGVRMLVLTSDADGPAQLARLLEERGLGGSRLHVLERLGGPHERVRVARADTFDARDVDPLQVVAIEVEDAPAHAAPMSLCVGLDDSAFEHDGQLTKREIRVQTLSRLAPRRGERLWDVGAGSGSIAIEWLRLDPSLSACAIEARADRVERIRRNARALGAPRLRVVHGRAPEALRDLSAPDAVFVGGGARPEVFERARTALRPGGRLVANAVTLETEEQIRVQWREHGGELVQLAVSHAAPLGAFSGWQPSRAIVQWSWVKA